jgi:O-antigen ligase/tetratricopeptide (TPR) repeat protein
MTKERRVAILSFNMTRQQMVRLLKIVALVGVYGGLLMPLVFIPMVIFPFVFSKLVMFQILIGLAFPSYLLLAWLEPKYRPQKALLYYAIGGYFVALALSVIFSVDPLRSWWGNQERMNGLFTLLHFFAWLTMAVGMLKTWDGWRRLLNYEIVLSVFMAAVALLQLVKKDLLLFPAGGRVGGLLDNPIYMGAYQIFNLSFLVLLFVKTRSKALRCWYAAAMLIDIAAFVAAQSRGALIGLAAVIGVSALCYALFTKERTARWGILGAAAACFLLYGTAFAFRTAPFIAESSFSRFLNLNVTSETRFIAWDIAWQGFLERPLTGWGLDTFHVLFNEKYNPRSLEFGYYETWFDRAHNTVMDVLSMTGIFGFVTFFGIFGALFYSVWRAYRRKDMDLTFAAILTALPVGYFLQNLFVFDHPAAFSMSYLLFALVIAATQPGFMDGSAAHASHAAEKKGGAPVAAFAVLQLIALFIVWQFSVQPFRASLFTIKYNKLFGVQPEAAWSAIQAAGKISTPYLDEQTFLLARNIGSLSSSGQFTQYPNWQDWFSYAKEVNERHLASHPRNTHQYFAYARLLQDVAPLLSGEAQMQTIAASEQAYRKAIATSPKRQQLYFALAQLYSMTGRKDETREVLKSALDFNRNIGEAWWYFGITSWLDMGRTEEGMDAVLQAVKAKVAYTPVRARDGLSVAQAAAARGETDLLRQMLPSMLKLQDGSVAIFLEIGRAYEQVGLLEERNTILNALQQADPAIAPQLQALRDGSAETIDASIAAAPAPVPMAATSTVPAPATPGGSGPRQ